MPGEIVASLIAVGVLVVINIVTVAFGYGRMTQKVSDLCRRVKRVEAKLGINSGDRGD